MAKAIITIQDKSNFGEVDAKIEFDPPASNNSDEPNTPAQCLAMLMFEAGINAGQNQDEEE